MNVLSLSTVLFLLTSNPEFAKPLTPEQLAIYHKDPDLLTVHTEIYRILTFLLERGKSESPPYHMWIDSWTRPQKILSRVQSEMAKIGWDVKIVSLSFFLPYGTYDHWEITPLLGIQGVKV